jgi:hypothetical protein
MSWIYPEDWGKYEKTKNISIVASDKNYAPGHKLRHEFLKTHKDKVDVYGSCIGMFLDDKIQSLKDYRFQIVIENCQTAGYYSEKLVDAFGSYTIPIYWGDPTITKVFDTSGMLICENLDKIKAVVNSIYESPEKAAKFYNDSIEHIENNYKLASIWKSPEDYIYEKILVPRGLV